MLFTDAAFLFYFLPFSLVLHRIALIGSQGPYPNRARFVIFFLTVLFYGFKEPWWLIPFFICIFFDFFWASKITHSNNPKFRLLLLWFSILQNLSLLAVFKYWNWLHENLILLVPELANWLPQLIQGGTPLELPPGISFYTFESMSFVIDVYYRRIIPPKQKLEFFAFIGMFPRFIAGPIVRFKDLSGQFETYSGMKLESGLCIFFYGLFLKSCFADHFEVFVKYAFDRNELVDFTGAWIGLISYGMQIYFDFAGYSMMAIGLGRCLGFQFPTNFNRPYLATSLKDFWTRWHISFTSWIRDYVYSPIALPALRRGNFFFGLTVLGILALSGLWHGSSWTFLLWGLWHGSFLLLEQSFRLDRRLPNLLRRIFTLSVVFLSWVFFRAKDLQESASILSALFLPMREGAYFNPEGLLVHPLSLISCLVGFAFCFLFEKFYDTTQLERINFSGLRERIVAFMMFLWALLMTLSSLNPPFLYFRF